MFPVGQYVTSPFFILSVTNKYHTSRCFVHLMFEVVPFSTSSIILLLSWYIIVVGMAITWADRKCHIHNICPIVSSMATSSASVELFV